MHDEDGDNGLWVSNPIGKAWKALGDSQLLQPNNKENHDFCLAALKVSVEEVYDAYRRGEPVYEAQFQAWTHTPILEMLEKDHEMEKKEHKNFPPLLRVTDGKLQARIGDMTVTDWKAEYALEGGILGIMDQVNWARFGVANWKKITRKAGKLGGEWVRECWEYFGFK